MKSLPKALLLALSLGVLMSTGCASTEQGGDKAPVAKKEKKSSSRGDCESTGSRLSRRC